MNVIPANACGIILGDYAYVNELGGHQQILWEHILRRNLEQRAEINNVLDESINNQALGTNQFKEWENFRFRSESEISLPDTF
jgi:hypothetical protein